MACDVSPVAMFFILEIGCDMSHIGIGCTKKVDLLKESFSSWKSICLHEKRAVVHQ